MKMKMITTATIVGAAIVGIGSLFNMGKSPALYAIAFSPTVAIGVCEIFTNKELKGRRDSFAETLQEWQYVRSGQKEIQLQRRLGAEGYQKHLIMRNLKENGFTIAEAREAIDIMERE